MKLRMRLDFVGSTLLAALGAAPLACGGSAFQDGSGGAGGTAGKGSAGTAGSGVASGSGGFMSTGAGGFVSSGSGGFVSSGSGGFVNTGGTSSGGAAGMNAFPCLDPTPVVDETTGYVACSNGYTHRTHQAECPSQLPRMGPIANYDPAVDQCQYDADCVAQPNGFCGAVAPFGGDVSGGRYCVYGCVNDADCGLGAICVCGNMVGECKSSTCTTDGDCQPGFNCASYEQDPGCPFISYGCQAPADTCGGNADCGAPGTMTCSMRNGNGSRSCVGFGCAVGRPFLVHGSERLAPVETRRDWLEADVLPRVEHLSAELRNRLGQEWVRAGQMEHASIAAFARFALQLLQLGAPPALLERTTSAMADETAHAKLCFAIASRYLGESVGPGSLAVDGSLDATSLEEVVVLAIREGCIGETMAAVEAAEASEHANDPAIRLALRRISADETRHAELAWRFVKWAIEEQGGAGLFATVEREFARLSLEASRTGAEPRDDDGLLLSNGVLPPALSRALRAQAMTQVVEPCVRALRPGSAIGTEIPAISRSLNA